MKNPVEVAELMIKLMGTERERDFYKLEYEKIYGRVGKNSPVFENQEMLKGVHVKADHLDNHNKHIQQHNALLEDPTAKQDLQLMKSLLDHIQEHLSLWKLLASKI